MAGLAIKIGGDASGFTNTMATVRNAALKNAGTVASAFTGAATKIDSEFAKAGSRIGVSLAQGVADGMKPLGLALAAGVLGFMALTKVTNEVAEAARAAEERLAGLVKIGVQARDAGVGTTFLQSLTGQAKALGTEVGSLTAMLDRAREASTVSIGEGDGKATSPILDRLRQNVMAKNLDASALDRFTGADSQEARIKVILDLMDQLKAKGATVAALDLGKTMFGGEFETKLRTGVDMVGAMRRALDGLKAGDQGRIIPPEEIQRAENLNRRLEEAQRLLEEGLAPINRDIALWQQQQLAGWVDIKEGIAAAAGQANVLYEWVKGIGKVLSDLGSANVFKNLRDSMDSMGLINKGEVARIERMLNGGLEPTDKPAVPKDADSGGPLNISVKPKGDTSKSLPSLRAPKTKAPTNSEISAIETFVGSLEKSAAALKAEADAYGKSAVERRISIELAKAEEIAKQNGTKLTEEQTRRIREASTALAEQREKLDDLHDRQALVRSGAGEMFHGMYSDVRNGATALDVLNNALGRVLDRIANSSIDSFLDGLLGKPGGNGGGILSGLIGGSSGGGLMGLLGLGGGGLSTDPGLQLVGAGVLHNGGIAGAMSGTSRQVHPGIFTGAPRFHAGLTASEFPAILERGERVLTARQDQRVSTAMAGLSQAAASRPANPGGPVNVQVGDTVVNMTPSEGVTPGQLQAVLANHRAEQARTIGQQLSAWKENN